MALLLMAESPRNADGQLDRVNIGLFIAALMVAVSGLAALIALPLHRRWPGLAGARRGTPDPAIGLRQGALVGVGVGAISLLVLFDRVDVTFVLITILLCGLVEAYFQSRS